MNRGLKNCFKTIWQFISYLFWPQKSDKSRYDDRDK